MAPTQRHQLGSALHILATALKNEHWPDAELALLVEKVKPGLDALHACMCGNEPTPWEWPRCAG